ncbi:hypothetical protein B0H19DRAFT_1260997 [Mycena capillaripes]|nr:hypothetical protein B0H19DRAFT_1260997 [Mycena capillaripes]
MCLDQIIDIALQICIDDADNLLLDRLNSVCREEILGANVGLNAQDRRRVAQAQALESPDAGAAAPPAPKARRARKPRNSDAAGPSAAGPSPAAPSAAAPAAKAHRGRQFVSGSTKVQLPAILSAPQFKLPPTFASPPATFAPQQPAPQQPAPQQPAPQQSAPQKRAAGTLRRQMRSETPAPRLGTATSQLGLLTALVAPASPVRASSLQAPATRTGAPVDYTPILPEQAVSPANLPPPPPSWLHTRRRSPLPPPVDGVDLEAKREVADDLLASKQEGEKSDDDKDDKEDSTMALSGGRPTREQRDSFDRAFADVCDRLAQCASETKVSYSGILKTFYQEEHTGLRPGKNTWNLYQRFANYDDVNRLRERRRLNPAYPSASPVPALKADKLSRAYKAFVMFAGGEEEADNVLSIFFQMGGTADDTIQARRRRFNTAVKTFEKLTDRIRLDDFFACTIIVGAHTNEDEKLGEVITIPGIQDALYDALATNENEIIGIQKTAAATIIIKEQAKMRRDQREASSSAAAPSSFAVPSSAAVSSSTARRSRPAASSRSAAPSQPVAPSQPAAPVSPMRSDRDLFPGASSATATTAAAAAAAVLPTNIPILRRDVLSKNTTIFPCEIRDDTPDLQDLRHVMGMASVEDIGIDIFKGNNGFSWTVLGPQLHEKGIRIVNYPNNVRLPSEAPPTKASSSWTRGERDTLPARNFVVLSHDYTLAPPASAPDSDVETFWTSSNVPVHCTASDNTSWEAAYNLDNPTTLVRPAPSKAEVKMGKKKAEPARRKAKEESLSQKRKADEEDEDNELEPEEETLPLPAKKLQRRTPESQVGGGGEPGSPRVEVAAPSRVRFMAADGGPLSTPDSDDEPIQTLAPLQSKPPVLLFDDDDAPALICPKLKTAPRKHVLPNTDSEDGNAGAKAVAVDPPVRVTRASSKASNPAPSEPGSSKAAPFKPAPSKTKPAKVFDGVEVTTPPKKKSKTIPATPAAEGSKLTSAASGMSRKMTAQRQRNPPQAQTQPPTPVVPAPVVPAPVVPAPVPAAPAAFAPAAPGAAPFAPPAGMTPAQMQVMLFAAAAMFGGALPPGA